MKTFILKVITGIFVFVGIDLPWIYFVVTPLYSKKVSSIMRNQALILPGLIFYVIIISSLFYLTENQTPGKASITAFLLGIVSYATYTLTNMSILKGWTYGIVVADILWGGFLTYITYKLTNLIIKG